MYAIFILCVFFCSINFLLLFYYMVPRVQEPSEPPLLLYVHKEKYFSESCQAKPSLHCIYHFSIDLAPIVIPIGARSIANG